MHLYERDCSVQRRHQKLIEESPAPGLERDLMLQQAQTVSDICQQLGYDNLGTVETLYTPEGDMGFLEMNTRIQVEHGVTEEVTGIDLVATQIELAAGGALPQQSELRGYAMEARLYAEDPRTMFPSTGKLAVFRPPALHGVRIETGYQEGQEVLLITIHCWQSLLLVGQRESRPLVVWLWLCAHLKWSGSVLMRHYYWIFCKMSYSSRVR